MSPLGRLRAVTRAALTGTLTALTLTTGCASKPSPLDPSPAPAGATRYSDPGGAYRLTVPNAWKADRLNSTEVWVLDPTQTPPRDNVNVVVKRGSTPITLGRYLQITVENARQTMTGFTISSQETIVLPSGQEAARLTYSGSLGGSPRFTFFAIIAVKERRAVIVTLTATGERFEAAVAAAEPYLRTLEVL